MTALWVKQGSYSPETPCQSLSAIEKKKHTRHTLVGAKMGRVAPACGGKNTKGQEGRVGEGDFFFKENNQQRQSPARPEPQPEAERGKGKCSQGLISLGLSGFD